MRRLSGAERRWLRGRAHHLKPVAHVGKAGLAAPAVAAIGNALTARELIKVRLLDAGPGRWELAAELEELLGCEVVGVIGKVLVLFRRNPDPERRVLELPFDLDGHPPD